MDYIPNYTMYAGYHMDGSCVELEKMNWEEQDAPKSSMGNILAQHCDIWNPEYMKQIRSIINRPWNLDGVNEMWVTMMPGTHECVISLVRIDGRPNNYPITGEIAKKVISHVNLWNQ